MKLLKVKSTAAMATCEEMKSSQRYSSFVSSSTFIYTLHNDHSIPPPVDSIGISKQSGGNEAAAIKIQSCYRAYMIRTLYKKISAVNSEANHLERLLQTQDMVDAIRSSAKEKVRMNEALMVILLRLDSVPGIDPTIREARRKVSRRIVELQEIMDSIMSVRCDEFDFENGLWRDWGVVVAEMEEEVCRERGGEEMERFCDQYLGFRCLQRFLRDT